LVRKAAQELNLHSDASNIYERCPDPEGTLSAVKRASRLILDHAGGLVSSEIIDLKKDIFKPRKITLHLPRLAKVSGFEFPKDKVINILSGLNLKPEQTDGKIDLSIPSYRNDLNLEEDIIEEIARIYGYNNLPKTLPASPPPTTTIAYNYSYKADNEVKRILQGLGYTEIYTYSLISKSQISTLTNCLKTSIKIKNPVSLEFEYLRPTLIVNLIEAVKLNQANFLNLKHFELGRTYHKTPSKTETNTLTLISNQGNFLDLKGSLELLFKHLGIEAVDFVKADETTVYDNPLFDKNQIAKLTGGKLQMGIIAKISAAAVDREEIKTDLFAAEINFDLLKKKMNPTKFKPIPTYPPIIEDLTLRLPKDVQIGDLIKEISLIDRLINQIQIQSFFNDKITFRIRYQSASGNLTSLDIQKIRKKIISRLQAKYSVSA